jgi:iron complex outermembrane receptor protein
MFTNMARVLSLFLLFSGIPLLSQGEIVTEVEEIVVTATATRSERQVLEVPAAVSIVSEERIADLPLMGVSEALNGLAGVQSETKNGGYDARLIIRGSGLKARYGVREIMVLLDGVPITDPDGMSRLDFVDTSLIKQIDVVRGPNSTLYGANAVGGVINFITRDPYEEYKSATVGYGSDNTQQYNLLYGTSFGDTFVSASGSYKTSDGWREWNEFSTAQGSLKLGQTLGDGSLLTGMVSYTDADLQLPGALTEAEFNEDPSQLTSDPFRHSGRYSKIISGNLRWEKEIGNWGFIPLFYANGWEHYHPVPSGMINDGGANIFGADLQANHKHTLFGSSGEMTIGISGQLDDGKGEKYTYRDLDTTPMALPFPPFTPYDYINFSLSDSTGDLAEITDESVSKLGMYLQESIRPSARWTVDLGVRYDYVNFDLSSIVFQEYNWGLNAYDPVLVPPSVISTKKTYDHISPRIGAAWTFSDQMSLYGNISTGFQTPQASELNENPALDPAVTTNYEVGFKGRHQQGHRLDLAFFYQQVKDEIVQTAVSTSQVDYSNAGETKKLGVELATEAYLPFGFNLGGTYTYSDFTFVTFMEPVRVGPTISPQDRSGNQLPYVPQHQYDLFISYRNSAGFKARFDTATWGEYWVDNANSEKYKGYDFVSKLMLGCERGPWDVVLNISNLFDQKYAMEVTMTDDLMFRPGAPRSFFAKVSYAF